MPSSMKGAARVVDLFGKLDEYKTYPDPDSEMLRKDWEVVGEDIRISMTKYEQKESKSIPATFNS